jgi:hypothetical protein
MSEILLISNRPGKRRTGEKAKRSGGGDNGLKIFSPSEIYTSVLMTLLAISNLKKKITGLFFRLLSLFYGEHFFLFLNFVLPSAAKGVLINTFFCWKLTSVFTCLSK